MKKLSVFISIAASVCLFACNKNKDAVATPANTVTDTAVLPHYNERNTVAVNWNELPSELRDAPGVPVEESINAASRVAATFSFATASWGGTGGTAFGYAPPSGYSILAVGLSTGAVVERLVVWYKTSTGSIIKGLDRGISTTPLRYYYFASGEKIEFVYGRTGALVDYLAFYTNKKVFSGGGWGGAPFIYAVPSNRQILGFFGRSGSALDRIGFYVYTL